MSVPLPIVVLAVPVVEVVVFALLAGSFGFLPTLLAVLLVSLIGMVAIRRQGTAALASIPVTLLDGDTDGTRRVADQVLKVVGAVLLIFPGFVTGAIGAALWLPPVRSVVFPLVRSRFASSTRVTMMGSPFFEQGSSAGFAQRFSREYVDVDVVDDAPDQTESPNPTRPRLR